ncbi:PmoA family protein, partial [bacterium]|nr:PmoA family protein [bacterium]
MNCTKICFTSLLLASVILISSLSWSEPGNPLEITIQNELLQVSDNNQPLLTYKYSGVPYKPYVQELFTPNGKNILRDAPHDHLHHHALMFAVSLNDVSFWEEPENPGSQEHQSFQQVNLENGSAATFEESLVWKHQASNTFANESRTISVGFVPKYKATLLVWQTTLTPTNQPIKVGGSHYYGLGMRFIESMDKIGTFLNSENKEGAIFRGEERLTDANWCAYT